MGDKRILGLRGKFLLVVLGPVLATFIILGVYSRSTMQSFGKKITADSTSIVTDLAEAAIIEKARAVAGQVQLALQLAPELPREKFNDNPAIHDLAVQRVGVTGYTVLWAVPEGGSDVSPTWVHPEKALIGKDTPPLVKKRLGERYLDWFNVYKGCYNGRESHGYYLWQDSEGRLREKFLACAPVENTPYAISATTYLDEFLSPVETVKTEVSSQIQRIGLVHLATMAIGLVISVFCVVYGIQKITTQIKRLTTAISSVSMGKVDNEITIVQTNDELQDLSEAFERMRTAVKYIMARLEKSRKAE